MMSRKNRIERITDKNFHNLGCGPEEHFVKSYTRKGGIRINSHCAKMPRGPARDEENYFRERYDKALEKIPDGEKNYSFDRQAYEQARKETIKKFPRAGRTFKPIQYEPTYVRSDLKEAY